MKNLKYIFLAFCLLFFYAKVKAQLTVINPSFEGTPAMHVTPAPWHTCMEDESPDTQPGIWSITMPPTNGSTYVGFVDTDIFSYQEGCSQQLSAPMTAGGNWHFTIDVTRENSNDGGITDGDIELLIYAGWNECGQSQLLYSTGNVPYMSWFTYDVTFIPNANYTHIFLQSHLLTGDYPYLLVDNMSPIEPVCDADAGDGAKICGLTYTFNGTVQAGYYDTQWSYTGPGVATFSPNDATPTATVTVTTPGLYTFTWTVTSPDALTCDDVITVEFTQIPTSDFTISPPILCFGDNTTITYTGNATLAATYTWNFDGGTAVPGTGQGPHTVSWATAGTHNVTLYVTEDGCTSTTTTQGIYNPPELITSIDTAGAIGCAGGSGSVTVNTSGGTPDYTYDWGGADPNNLPAGSYCVTITDANACSNIECFTITEPNPLTVTTNQTNLNCFGVCDDGYAELIVLGGTPGPGYVYVWSNDPFLFTPDQDSMCAGTYTVVAIDFNLCEITAYFTITEPAPFTATISDSTDVTCNGICNGTASVITAGGIPPYSYDWPGTETTANVTGLCAGDYTVTVTDTNSCPAYATVSIEEPPALIASITGTNVNCNSGYDGAADLTVTDGTPPYTYEWTYGQTDPDIGNLTAGTYCVTVTDFNSCTTTECVTITEPATPISATTNVTNLLCHGDASGVIDLTVSGGTPYPAPNEYMFLWSNGITDEDVNNLAGGNYTVTITDANLCVTLAFATVTEPGELIITTSPDVTICIGQDTNLTATAISGTGTPPFTYHWSNGYDGPDPITVSPDTTATYYVSATDDNGCESGLQSVTVYVFPPLNITLRTDDDTLCPGDSTVIYADNYAGSGDGDTYTFTYNGDTVSPSFTVYPNTTTSYEIIINDGCTERYASDTIEIVVVDVPEVVMNANPLEGCEPLTVQFLESSPDESQTYFWNFGDAVFDNISYQKNPEHTFERDGTYNVKLTVTSKEGCIILDSNTIVVYPNPDAEFRAEPITASIIKPLIFFENLSTNDSINHWNFGDGDSVSIILPGHTDHKYTRSGNFTVCLIAESKDECKDTICMDIIIKDEFTFYAPTAFSPDNDDINDVFLPVGIGIDPENFLMIIYDRWGEKVFVTHDLYQGWDGRIKGKKIGKNGVYSWLVIYKDLQGVEHQQAGAVSLIR